MNHKVRSKVLATNGNFQLVLEPDKLYCYSVYTIENPMRKTELARTMKLTKSVTMWFTEDQIRKVKAKLQAAKRAAKTYGLA